MVWNNIKKYNVLYYTIWLNHCEVIPILIRNKYVYIWLIIYSSIIIITNMKKKDLKESCCIQTVCRIYSQISINVPLFFSLEWNLCNHECHSMILQNEVFCQSILQLIDHAGMIVLSLDVQMIYWLNQYNKIFLPPFKGSPTWNNAVTIKIHSLHFRSNYQLCSYEWKMYLQFGN